jgi:hypothetical protein
MGWFNEDDRLVSPPGPKEVFDIHALMSSKGGSITIMDFHVALALYKTADDVKELHDLPQKLLFVLHVHVDENPLGDSCMSKTKVIKRFEDAVCSYLHSFSFLALTLR